VGVGKISLDWLWIVSGGIGSVLALLKIQDLSAEDPADLRV